MGIYYVILKYVKNFGDSYQKGNFPFGIKDQFPVIKQVGGRKSSKKLNNIEFDTFINKINNMNGAFII